MCTELCKGTTCDRHYISPIPLRYTTMKIHSKPAWLSAKVKELIDPPPIPLIKESSEDVIECDIININMSRSPSAAGSETYELNIETFENGQPE